MSLSDIVAKLKEGYQFIVESAPDALERVADFADSISDAARKASEWFKTLTEPRIGLAGDDFTKSHRELEKFQEEVRQFANSSHGRVIAERKKQANVSTLPVAVQLTLAKLLAETCSFILDKIDELTDSDDE